MGSDKVLSNSATDVRYQMTTDPSDQEQQLQSSNEEDGEHVSGVSADHVAAIKSFVGCFLPEIENWKLAEGDADAQETFDVSGLADCWEILLQDYANLRFPAGYTGDVESLMLADFEFVDEIRYQADTSYVADGEGDTLNAHVATLTTYRSDDIAKKYGLLLLDEASAFVGSDPVLGRRTVHRYDLYTLVGLEIGIDTSDIPAFLAGTAAGSETGPGAPAVGIAAALSTAVNLKGSASLVVVRHSLVSGDASEPDPGNFELDEEHNFIWEMTILVQKGGLEAEAGLPGAGLPLDVSILLPGSAVLAAPDELSDLWNTTTGFSDTYLPPSFFRRMVGLEFETAVQLGATMGYTFDLPFTRWPSEGILVDPLDYHRYLVVDTSGFNAALAITVPSVSAQLMVVTPSLPYNYLFADAETVMARSESSAFEDTPAFKATIGFPTSRTEIDDDDAATIVRLLEDMAAYDAVESYSACYIEVAGWHSNRGTYEENVGYATERANNTLAALMNLLAEPVIFNRFRLESTEVMYVLPARIESPTDASEEDNQAKYRVATISVHYEK